MLSNDRKEYKTTKNVDSAGLNVSGFKETADENKLKLAEDAQSEDVSTVKMPLRLMSET